MLPLLHSIRRCDTIHPSGLRRLLLQSHEHYVHQQHPMPMMPGCALWLGNSPLTFLYTRRSIGVPSNFASFCVPRSGTGPIMICTAASNSLAIANLACRTSHSTGRAYAVPLRSISGLSAARRAALSPRAAVLGAQKAPAVLSARASTVAVRASGLSIDLTGALPHAQMHTVQYAKHAVCGN